MLKWIGGRRRFTRALQNFACNSRSAFIFLPLGWQHFPFALLKKCLEHFFIFSFYSYSYLHPVLKQTWNYAMAILGDGEANHFEFQIYRHKRRRFRSEEDNTNLNKFFHFDENVEIYREMRLWSVPCIDSSSSCFGVLYATMVDWQMIQRYLRHLSFYSAPSCLKAVVSLYRIDSEMAFEHHWSRLPINDVNTVLALKKHFVSFLGLKELSSKYGLGDFDVEFYHMATFQFICSLSDDLLSNILTG